MPSILTRPVTAIPVPTTGNAQRPPRKKSSFLSLRKGKDRSSPALVLDPPSSYFDAYPRTTTGASPRRSGSRTQGVLRPSLHGSDSEDSAPLETEREDSSGDPYYPDPVFTFPTLAGDVNCNTIRGQPHSRSLTGISRKSGHIDSSIPGLRFSGSSTQTQTETPPQTPRDSTSIRGSLDYASLVAAPVSGVETMDALVDGMNGIDGDDFLSGSSSRSRFAIPGHHPLYQPPLPTPPPGIVLGKAAPGMSPRSSNSGDEAVEEEPMPVAVTPKHRRRRARPTPSRTVTDNLALACRPPSSPRPPLDNPNPSSSSYTAAVAIVDEVACRPSTAPSKSLPPSISEIIRMHASHVRSRPSNGRASSYTHSMGHSTVGHATVHEEQESEPEPLNPEEEAELLSRSSVDSIADEVRQTLRNQSNSPIGRPPYQAPSSYSYRVSLIISDGASIRSPLSDAGREPSIYSSSAASIHPPSSPFETTSFTAMMRTTPSQAVAQYLHSSRLTTLLKLTRGPHASLDNPLTVSLSDLGDPSGFPLLVFLGLGCVRQVMGLYDEMAECLGLRLITIDRWGLGRTEPRAKSSRGIMEWAAVVEEVLDLLRIDQCSVMAHSAGAPYALSFANKAPERIRGNICLLAPWVGGSETGGGYKWLKYVPNGILKTAQAAEWKIQAWMIGKPPTIAYEGIGYTAPSSLNLIQSPPGSKTPLRTDADTLGVYSLNVRRPSIASSSFSEYDDLGDFEGRFGSRSTLGATQQQDGRCQVGGAETKQSSTRRKPSRGFLKRLKVGVGNSQTPSPTSEKPAPQSAGRRLKALRSMGSLRSKANTLNRKSEPPTSPQLPHPEIGLGFDEMSWTNSIASETTSTSSHTHYGEVLCSTPPKTSLGCRPYSRAGGRRSMSFTASSAARSLPSSPSPSSPSPSSLNSPYPNSGSGITYQASLGNALIAASHAESINGLHNDLLQILNHENHPWGFSYSTYPHKVNVWYGDKDEKIAENAVRWMERNMGHDRCQVKVVKGADHGLMYKSAVVVEVLEHIRQYW